MAAPTQSPVLPGIKHKVIGLVSGGKDSCFNLMHCVANGHEVVALATLTPEEGIDELDSHLYQSVGTDLLPKLAISMGAPHYTRVIRGKAVAQGPEYGSRLRGGEGSGEDGDETEDLTGLLLDVLRQHPEATALASGAILSTYQRLRIEHVCSRLGLTSLSYLWQSEQSPLLDRMLSSGVEAVLVKVAGVGLGAEVVGKSLGEVRGLLARLETKYGSHPAGEGGEYETLTLSTPLFSHRLNLSKTRTIVTDPEPYTVAYLKVEESELVPKEGWVRPTVVELREMLGLDSSEEGAEGLDEEGREALGEIGVVAEDEELPEIQGRSLSDGEKEVQEEVRFAKKGRWFTASVQGRSLPDEDVGQELKRCFDAISTTLNDRSLSLPIHSTHITLLLSSMSLFLPANAVYKTYFGTSPPSRATVAVPLPSSSRIRVEVVGYDDTPLPAKPEVKIGGRSALHVQSQSYWAPANIGPYSQAVLAAARLHLAGQIPLIPASLTLPEPPKEASRSAYPLQATLALQHVRKIVQALRSKNATGGGWEGWVESSVGWWARPSGDGTAGTGSAVGVVRRAWEVYTEENGSSKAPVLFVQARELPKGALVEYQVNLHTGRRDDATPLVDEDDDDDLEGVYASGTEGELRWESSLTSGKAHRGSRAAIFAHDLGAFKALSTPQDNRLARLLQRAVTIRAYHLTNVSPSKLSSLLSSAAFDGAAVTPVPVLSVHDRLGKAWAVGLEVFGV
ncbi:hypothetical protein IAT38_001938 [Cryptococcus sp. DSM 104549]